MNLRSGIMFIVLLFCSVISFAQTDTIKLKKTAEEKKAIVTDRPPQAVYFGLGGSGPIFSVNYDRRFSKKLNGLGFSIGAGFFGETGISIFSIPASINVLAGRQNHFLEVAAGATFVSATVDWFEDSESGSGFLGHVNVGYRYQPAKGGFFARTGVSPLFALTQGGGYVTSYYIGLGYSF